MLFPGVTSYGGEGFLLEPKHLNRWSAIPQTWFELWLDYSLGSSWNGFGVLTSTAGFSAFAVQFISSGIRRHWAVLVHCLTCIAIVFLHPSAWQPRYSLVVVPICAVALGYLFNSGRTAFRMVMLFLVICGLIAGIAHAVPYQVSGNYQPPAFIRAALKSQATAVVGARDLLPDTDSVHQRLLLDPAFSRKRIVIGVNQYIGNYVRTAMDTRIMKLDNYQRIESFIERERPDYIYVTTAAEPSQRERTMLAQVRSLASKVRQVREPLLDQRMIAYYGHPAHREYLFEVLSNTTGTKAQ